MRDLYEGRPDAADLRSLALFVLAALGGALLALVVLPHWLPGLSRSLVGSEPKGFWYLSRASGWVAYALLWASMALGLGLTNRLARLWPGAPAAFELHQHVSLLALACTLFHALVLLGDRYVVYSLATLALPFASTGYRPIAVGLGQLAFYTLAVVTLSFYVRRQLGHRGWRRIHYASFAVFLLALAHGLTSGTDSATWWARALYWSSGASLLYLTVYRILTRPSTASRPSAASRPAATSPATTD
jgi:predicted ferric reductase